MFRKIQLLVIFLSINLSSMYGTLEPLIYPANEINSFSNKDIQKKNITIHKKNFSLTVKGDGIVIGTFLFSNASCFKQYHISFKVKFFTKNQNLTCTALSSQERNEQLIIKPGAKEKEHDFELSYYGLDMDQIYDHIFDINIEKEEIAGLQDLYKANKKLTVFSFLLLLSCFVIYLLQNKPIQDQLKRYYYLMPERAYVRE